MANHGKSTPRRGRYCARRRATLTSGILLKRGQRPSPADIRSALNCLNKAAAHMERNENYAACITKECLSKGHRSDLLRAASVLIFNEASADTVWDTAEFILVPLLIGLCQGQYQTGNVMGTGMCGSDGRDYLRELHRDEGEPLSRIIDAMARYCPHILYGTPESSND